MLRSTKTHLKSLLNHRVLSVNVLRLKSGIIGNTQRDDYEKAQPVHSNEKTDKRTVLNNRNQTKLPTQKPLVKNFFVGLVDKELLGYPEVISREEMSNLQEQIMPLKNYFDDKKLETLVETTHTIPESVFNNLKQLNIYGLNVPLNYDGKGYNWSGSLIASEPETEITSIALSLLSHRIVVDCLRELGTEEQQEKYLSRLANGDLVGAEAVYEYVAPEDDFFQTKAVYNSETHQWVLNGEKAYVVTGPLPQGSHVLFLVIAQTQQTNVSNESGRSITIFLVESEKAGVKIGDQHLTMGCRGTHIRKVAFIDVKLSEDSIVGMVHDGNKYAETIIRCGRLRTSLLGATLAKKSLSHLTQHCIQSKQCGTYLKDMELVRMQLASATCSIYAIESMIYHTAGLLDEFQGQDVTLEASIIKVKYYTMKKLFQITKQSLHIVGSKSLHAGEITETVFRNSAHLCTQGESLDTLSMFIALSGLQHAGLTMNDIVRKARNPLFNPGHIFGKFFETTSIENPNTKMNLAENLHPSLSPAALCIEHSVARLQMSVELMFNRHGSTVVDRHIEMQRIADIASTIYAMYASASRASRSYCIGLPLADHEMLTATAICIQGRDTVKTLCTELFNGSFVNNDNNLLRLAPQVTKSTKYFAVHPLTYNF